MSGYYVKLCEALSGYMRICEGYGKIFDKDSHRSDLLFVFKKFAPLISNIIINK